MSTRCQIAFYDDADEKNLNNFTALIYRHSDGYPEKPGVLPNLKKFFKEWIKTGRMNDTEYTAARCLQFLTNLYDEHSREFREEDDHKMIDTGYGICEDFHGDIQYLYAVYSDRIDVYDVSFRDISGVPFGDEDDINERVTLLKKHTHKF